LFEELIYAKSFFVYQDSVLIVENNRYSGVFFIEFYDIRYGTLLAKLFSLGNGPNEMLGTRVTIQDNIMTVNDFRKDQVAFVNIDSVLHSTSYLPQVIRHYSDSPTAVRYKEGLILMENPNCFKNKELGIDQKAPRFIVTQDKQPYIESNIYQYYTFNVAQGEILISNVYNRIIYADGNLPILEIYDYDRNLIKTVSGPDKLDVKYVVRDNEVIFSKKIPYTYLHFCTKNEYIYFTYIGDFLVPRKNREEDLPCYLFKFDWEGNIVDSYYVGRYITTVSVSSDGKSIYATAFNKENNPFLIKLQLDEN
jgi:hypothetical protein